jgi:hypothetical protein
MTMKAEAARINAKVRLIMFIVIQIFMPDKILLLRFFGSVQE